MLRIPSWAEGSRVRVNDGEYVSANAGAYHTITREWKNGDTIELELSMNIHFTYGEFRKSSHVLRSTASCRR